jgi:hypothetical protein
LSALDAPFFSKILVALVVKATPLEEDLSLQKWTRFELLR